MLYIFLFFVFFSSSVHAQTEKNDIDTFYYTGLLHKKPAYQKSSDKKKNYTPYYVGFDFATDTCTIYHTDSKSLWNDDLIKFAMYHEASHCVLYQEAIIYRDKPQIFYLLLADSLNYQQDKKMGYMYFHELYADSLATAILLREKDGRQAIDKMIKMRGDAFFGGHQTEKLLDDIIKRNWEEKDIDTIKALVLEMTEHYFLEIWVKQFFGREYESNSLPNITKSLIQTFYGWQHAPMDEEIATFYEFTLDGYSEKMKNPEFALIETMYRYRNEFSQEQYLEKVCGAGPWCY